jgi:hypothetical protein
MLRILFLEYLSNPENSPAPAARKADTMRDSSPSPRPGSPRPGSPRLSFMLVLAILAMIVVPAAVTLHTVHLSALNPATATTPGASPYGYTVSLLLFIVPILVIAFWFVSQESVKIEKKSFLWTIGLLFPVGAGLDFFFARYFFTFPNENATLGIKAPALGAPVPIEEYAFYLTGFLCVLLLYLWLDQYWLAAYNVETESAQRKQFRRLFKFHPESMILGIVLVAGAIIYKKFFSPYPAVMFRPARTSLAQISSAITRGFGPTRPTRLLGAVR